MDDFGAMPLRCIRSKPTGFSEPSHYESECIVIAFIFGKHRDAHGYDRPGDTLLCVFMDESGYIEHAPARQFQALKEDT